MSPPMDVEQGTATAVKGQAPTAASEVVLVNADGERGNARNGEGCQCTPGWILFGVGWAVPLCWLVGVFLPLCTKNRQDKRAAIGSGVMVVVYALVLGLVLGLYVVPMIAFANALYGPGPNNNLAGGSLAAQMAAAANQLSAAAQQATASSQAANAAAAAAAAQQAAAGAAAAAAIPAGVTGNLTCYQGTGGGNVQAVLMNNLKAEALLCAKYSITCTPQQVSCTAAQIAAEAVVWNYAAAARSFCTSLASLPSMYMGVTCCETDLCNAPIAAVDPGTTVVPGVITIDWQ